MTATKRQFSREFKLEVVRQVADGEKHAAQVCREYHLCSSVYDRWRREYVERGEMAFSEQKPVGEQAKDQRIAELCALLWKTGDGERSAKKSAASVPLPERHTLIEQVHEAHPAYSIRQMCRSLQVNRSWYYRRKAEPMALSEEEIALRDEIERIILDFPGYGYRRVTHALHRQGWSVNHKRVLRIMREESLLCQLKRQFVHTTDSQHDLLVYPNLIRGRSIEAPNQVWVGDITSVRLPTCFVYLAILLDSFSRTCVGWRLSRWIDAQLVVDALHLALAWRPVQPGWIHHSDRGVQYASSV